MNLRDRMTIGDPLMKDVVALIDSLTAAVSALLSHVFSGTAPHITDDTADEVTTADPLDGDLETVIDLEKALELSYATHIASASYHPAADSTNVTTSKSVYTKIKTLADELKTDYNAHRVLVSGSPACHGAADSTHVVSASAVSSKASAITLLNEIKADFNAHCADTESHGTSTILTNALALVNELKADYEAHRVLVAGGEHGGADATNAVTVADMTTKESAVALLNDIKAQFNAHCGTTAGSVHGAADTANVVSATDLASDAAWQDIADMADAIRTGYEAHRVLTAGSVHGAADSTNAVSASALGTVSGTADTTNTVSTTDLGVAATWTEIQVMADAIRTKYEAHRVYTTGGRHGSADATNTVSASAVGAPQTAVNAHLTDLKAQFNAHILLQTSHYSIDNSMTVSAAAATTLATSITLAKAIKASFNEHISRAVETALSITALDDLNM